MLGRSIQALDGSGCLFDGMLLSASVEWSLLSARSGGVECRRGAPKMSLSMRLCVRWTRCSMSFVGVHEVHPYIIVGVTVPSNSRIRDLSGYVLLVSSCRNMLNLRQAAATPF